MDGEAHYLRIASEIRDRIRSGRLKPGDKAPSTRAIVRDWGVAMATATRVLSELKQGGFIETRPGYGSVVLASSPRPTTQPTGLTADRIVASAVAIADEEGLPALTMRRIAVTLDVATMSLYRHVDGKDVLVDRMIDRVLREQRFPTTGRSPRERLDAAARALWSAFRRHPWAASAVSLTRPQLLPSLLEYADLSLSSFRSFGLDAETAMHAHLTLFAFVRSSAENLEAEEQARRDTGMTNEEWIDGAEIASIADSGAYPAFDWVARTGYDYDIEKIFTFGLDLLLDGFERLSRDGGPPES